MKEIAEARFSDPEQVQDAVERQLRTGSVWSSRDDRRAFDGLYRAILCAGDWRGHFAAAVSALLDHEDREVRSGAVEALSSLAPEVGAARIAGLLEARPELYRGVPLERGWTLEGRMLHGLGQAAQPGDARAAALLRGGLEEHRLAAPLSRVDPDWVVAHARERMPREYLGAILRYLPTAAHREAFVRALAPWAPGVAEESWWRSLPVPAEERQRLQEIVAGRG